MREFLSRLRERIIRPSFEGIPELSKPIPSSVVAVDVGRSGVGDVSNSFVSKDFYCCSALLLYHLAAGRYGLLHMTPRLRIDRLRQAEKDNLHLLAGARAIPVEGSHSAHNSELFLELKDIYNISVDEPQMPETDRVRQIDLVPFHVVFRPENMTALVARVYFGDVLSIDLS